MEADQLQKLIHKCLSGAGTEQDWTLLKSALETEENILLRNEFLRLGRLEDRDLKADDGKMWEQISRYRPAGRDRLTLMRRVMRYVAIVTLPLLIGGIFFWAEHLKTESTPVAVVSLEPGQNRAILKLDNGEEIDLGGIGRDTVLVRDGITIRLDSSRSVSYQLAQTGKQGGGYNTIVVPRGAEYRLALSDGSIVWLNSDSELKYPAIFAEGQRKVFLKGEAYFEVAKNPDQPFIVDVTQMEVKVLGTQFNINAYREDGVLQTTLVKGKVEVADLQNQCRVILQPDQQALLKDGKLFVREVDASVYTAWREGKFYFESESLQEIAAQLERWYDIRFSFTREELKQEEFTGVIRRDFTADQILDIIAKTTNVRFEVKGRIVTVD